MKVKFCSAVYGNNSEKQMGMPEKPQNGMNIAPDGTVYEILEDGTIKRIGKVSPDGSFEPFGGAKEGIREKDGIIYRVINGKEVKIGRILPNGEIESTTQRNRNEAEIAKSKVEIVKTVSILIAFVTVVYALVYVFNQHKANDSNSNDNSVQEAAAEAKLKAAKKAESGGGTRIGSLYWSKRSRNEMNWNAAVKYCQNLNEGGYSDWRLPTISELRTTIKNCSGSQSGGSCRVSDNCLGSNCWSDDCRCEYRQNNGGYYSKLGDDDNVELWSSSVPSDYPNLRWIVHFSDGYVYGNGVELSHYVRCVR